jgi:exosortase/archaeosortase family protein
MKQFIVSFFKNPVTVFLGKVLLLYIAWDWLMSAYLQTSPFAYWLSGAVTNTAIGALDVMGYAVRGYHKVFGINIDGKASVFLANACNGLDFMGIFFCFVLAYPASWKPKVWFIPMGIVAIHLLNVVRVILLALNMHYFRSTFDFNHKYTFMIAVYALIFWFWTTWVKYYGYQHKTA